MFFKNRQEINLLMEIYKDLSSPASKEFERLLNGQLSKENIEEGKIIEGKINKITEKFVFLFVEGLKSEPVIDINELKSMGLTDKIKIGEYTNPIKVGNNYLILKIEDKRTTKISINKEKQLKEMINFETNRQLNQFSNIYFNKAKINYSIDEI